MAVNDSFIYQLPTGTIEIQDVLFNLPNTYTGDIFINLWLIGVWAVFFTGGIVFDQGAQRSTLYAGFGTMIVTSLLTFGGWAGGNQLIPALVLFIAGLAINYASDGGVRF